MKVSKTLREYIEGQVHMKAKQSSNIVELERKANEAKEKFNAEKAKIEDEYREAIKNLHKKYNFAEKHYAGDYNLPDVIAYKKAESELEEKERLAVLNIIAEMELGGTKAELMEKLDNLTF